MKIQSFEFFFHRRTNQLKVSKPSAKSQKEKPFIAENFTTLLKLGRKSLYICKCVGDI